MSCRFKYIELIPTSSLALRLWLQSWRQTLSQRPDVRASSKLAYTKGESCRSMQSMEPCSNPCQRPGTGFLNQAPGRFDFNSLSNRGSGSLLKNLTLKPLQISKRQETGGPPNNDHEKDLMAFSPKVLPNLWHSWKNFFITHMIIRPYLDNDFTTQGFIQGAKQALIFVSNNLAEGNLEPLRNVLSEDVRIE